MKVFITKIEKIIKSREELISKLSLKDKMRFNQITSHKRQAEFLAGRWLIFECFGGDFKVLEGGKIVSESAYLSLSHSADFAALSICQSPVGLDMEYMSPARNIKKIASRMGFGDCSFTEFYQKWTAREADFKLGIKDAASYHTFKVYQNYMICLSSVEQQTIELTDMS